MLVTLLYKDEFRVTHLEMIKGIKGLGYTDTLVIPIIDNTPHEEDLKESMAAAMDKYPNATAVLVRRHGVYVWGCVIISLSLSGVAHTINIEIPGRKQRHKRSAMITWYLSSLSLSLQHMNNYYIILISLKRRSR